MKIYHQAGHNHNWNIDSFSNDGVGEGIIFSPVNIALDNLNKVSVTIRQVSLLDPQIYLPSQNKSQLKTYDYFPENIKPDFKTSDFGQISNNIAQKCIQLQRDFEFKYIIIPTRYYDDIPSDYYGNMKLNIIDPFLKEAKNKGVESQLIMTVIVKSAYLTDSEKQKELLNWITGFQNINRVYLIFENNFTSKQIKDIDYLLNALLFIGALKENDIEVFIGYNDIEGLIYSIAMPNSITVGSFENLRSFNILRFIDSEKTKQQGPNARIYSGKLLQWIEYSYLAAFRRLYPNHETLFEDTIYKPLMFVPDYKWHFSKPELYKHYFLIFSNQVSILPQDQMQRISHVKKLLADSIALHEDIKSKGIVLDSDSDGSHLTQWLNVVNIYEKHILG